MIQRSEIKQRARALRRRGKSMTEIGKIFGINKSTLSYWFHNITLSQKQTNQLQKSKLVALGRARKLAVVAHNKKKEERIKDAKNEATTSFKRVDMKDVDIREACLAALYLGEGFKKNKEFGLGNSNPNIVKLFLSLAIGVYGIPKEKFYGELHLRADQNAEKMINFWSKELKISHTRFRVHVDRRTAGSKTYAGYYGVCSLRGGPVRYQRRVMFFGDMIIKKIVEDGLRD